MRCVVFGDGAWAVETIKLLNGAKHDVRGVVLRRNPIDDALPTFVHQSGLDSIQPESVNHLDVVDWVRACTPDLAVAVFYDQIIREPLLSVAPKGFTNVHPGKLPWYRGRAAIHWAMINNEPEIGLTVHFMNARVDAGDVLIQRTLPVDFHDTYASVIARIRAEVPRIVFEAVQGVATGAIVPVPQPVLGSYFGQRGPGDEWIDWNRSSLEIYNFIRALSPPGPIARTRTTDRAFLVQAAQYDPVWPKYRATEGQVVGVEDGCVRVKTADSSILLTSIVPADNAQEAAPPFPVSTRFLTQAMELRLLREDIERLKRSAAERTR